MNWPLLVLSLLVVGVPSLILILDRGRDVPFRKTVRTLGIPGLVIAAFTVVYSYAVSEPISGLIFWGLIGGIAGTATLDAVRLAGVRLKAFPLDMPVMFGLISLGIASRLPRHIMANLVAMVSEMPDEERRKMLEPRLKAISKLEPAERRLVMSMMMDGLTKLSEEKRLNVRKTMMETLAQLPAEGMSAVMKTMDQLTFGSTSNRIEDPQPPLMPIFRDGRLPQLPMTTAQQLLEKSIPQVATAAGRSMGTVKFAGYLWHLINGITYGVGYTLLFGSGSLPLAVAWGLFIDLVMMMGMPLMMPMIRLPYPRFAIAPYLAHIAMVLPFWFFAATYINAEETSASLLGSILSAGDTFLTLTVGPIVAIVLFTAIIFGGHKAYTKRIYMQPLQGPLNHVSHI